MTRSVHVLCHASLAPGFRLAGIPTHAASSAGEALEQLDALRAQEDVGVILLEAPFYDALPAETLRALEREPVPLVVPFPSPAWVEVEAPEAFVLELLRGAIGYRVRLS